MEEIVGTSLKGSVDGDIHGDVQLVAGKRGKALYTNGVAQWVDLGNQRSNCMGNLNKCDNGFVMAMWLKMHPCDSSDKYYITSGGHTRTSMGVALLMKTKKLLVMFRTASWRWELTYPTQPFHDTWYHVVLTWTAANGANIYINGAIGAADEQGYSYASNLNGDTYTKFVLGTESTQPPTTSGEMTIDELRIWDAAMNEQDIWSLYAADLMT